MEESLDLLTKPFLQIKGNGTISFVGGLTDDVEFVIVMLHNGTIRGDVIFSNNHFQLLGYTQKMERFTLRGVDSERENTAISAKDCFLTSYQGVNCKFSSHEIVWNPDAEQKKTNKELSIRLSLVNVYETFRVQCESRLGTLILQQYESHKEMEQLMSNYKIPLITSLLSLHIKIPEVRVIQDISNEAEKMMEDFLKITSLSQTTWHDWTVLEIYEQVESSNQGNLIYMKLRSPKLKPPHYRQLTNLAYSDIFMREAWKGYSHDNDIYGFDFALEWYIESNSASLDVTRLILASTCLELLISKFYALGLVKPSPEEIEIRKLYKSVRRRVKEFLKLRNVEEELIVEICRSITRRSTYIQKAKTLLDYWGISISDISMSLEEIVEIRDKIIHRGLYFHDIDVEKAVKVFDAAEDLFQILTRIILAMLKYNGDYFDPPRSRWIKFVDVCSKVGSPGFHPLMD